MKCTIIFVNILLFIFSAQAIGLFLTPDQQILESEMIAIVDIKDVEFPEQMKCHTNENGKITVSITMGPGEPPQRASVSLIRALKGKPDKEFVIVHDDRHVCLHPEFKQGRYLVFLQRNSGDIVLTDGQYSLRPIRGDIVEWYKKATSGDKIASFYDQSLQEVIQEIQNVTKKK